MSSTRVYPVPSNTRFQPNWVRKTFMHRFRVASKADPNFCENLRKLRNGELTESTMPELHRYQDFIRTFMRFDSPFRTMLLYHGTGTGKTRTTIELYNQLHDASPGWNVIVLTKKALQTNWEKELDRFLSSSDKDMRRKNVQFVAYNGPNPYTQLRRCLQEVKLKGIQKNFYIIEEAHNFVSQVYGNTRTETRQSLDIYHWITNELETNETTRVLLLTATPIINDPVELTYMFNMLRPKTFNTNLHDFRTTFLTQGSVTKIRPEMINILQRRIMGLVSYYEGDPIEYFATIETKWVHIPMSDYQLPCYDYIEEVENTSGSSSKERMPYGTLVGLQKYQRGQSGMFQGLTQPACNFIFPAIPQEMFPKRLTINVNGRERPRPFMIRKRMKQEGLISDEDNPKVVSAKVDAVYRNVRQQYMLALRLYLAKLAEEDHKRNHTIKQDMKTFLASDMTARQYLDTLQKIIHTNKTSSKTRVSDCLAWLYRCSPKMTCIALSRVRNADQNAVIYSKLVDMEGLEIMCMYLDFFGYSSYTGKAGTHQYIDLSRKRKQARKILEKVNDSKNCRGGVISTILISPALAEGINIFNVRETHIIEPYWNENRMQQVIGRGRRLCSHADLNMDERNLTVYRYLMTRPNGGVTADEKLQRLSNNKNLMIDSFLQPLRQVAVDCALWSDEHRKKNPQHICFRFASQDLIQYPKAAAYRKNFNEDIIKGNSGLNAPQYQNKSIDLVLQNAVMKKKMDKPKKYWMDMNDGYVYAVINQSDIGELVGQVERNPDDGCFYQLNFDCYIITFVVQEYNQFAMIQ